MFEQNHLVRVNDGPVYAVDLTFEERAGRMRLTSITVSSDPQNSRASLDAAQLSRLRLGEVIQAGYELITEPVALRMDPWSLIPDSVAERIWERVVELVQEQGESPDPRSRSFDHFGRVAAIYEAAARSGLRPTEQVERAQKGLSKAAAEKQILRAREFGLLPPPHPGRQQAWIDIEDDEEATK